MPASLNSVTNRAATTRMRKTPKSSGLSIRARTMTPPTRTHLLPTSAMRLSRTPRANAAHGSFEGWSFSKLMFVWYASHHFSLQMKHRSSRTFHQVGISTDELEGSRVHQDGNCRGGFAA